MKRPVILAALVAAILALVLGTDVGETLSLANLQAERAALVARFEADPWLVSGLFFAFYVAVTALSVPGAAVMTLAAGAVFGLVQGLVLVSFASSVGATLAFAVSRWFLRDTVEARLKRQLAAINRGVERDGARYLFSLRLVPLFPFWMINLLMGLTRLPTRTFYWVSQVGMLPGTFVFVLAGTRLAEVRSPGDVLSADIVLVFVLLAAFPWIVRPLLGAFEARRRLAPWKAQRPARFDYNLVVIGGGSGGLIAALIAATVRAKVALIERDRMGGDCLNTGCVPSKTLIRAARAAQDIRDAHRFGIEAGPPRVDFSRVMERVREVIRTIEPNDSVERYTGLGVDCVAGEAVVENPWTVRVGERRMTARAIVVATGGRPVVPRIPGLDSVQPLTSDDVWTLDALPERLLVMGGGPIGCELAQAFARLGSEVTVIDMADRLLPREDDDVAALVRERLERKVSLCERGTPRSHSGPEASAAARTAGTAKTRVAW